MRENYRRLLKDVLRVSHRRFMRNLEASGAVRSLLYESGITDRIIDRFGVGYATDDWSSLTTFFESKESYYVDTARTLGLLQSGKRGEFDYFRGRILVPVTDCDGNPAGFTSRTVNSLHERYREKKFDRTVLHSNHSPVFNKRDYLVGFNQARPSVQKRGRVLVTLDPLELLRLHDRGRNNTVMELLPGGFDQPRGNSQHRKLLDDVEDLTVLSTKRRRVES